MRVRPAPAVLDDHGDAAGDALRSHTEGAQAIEIAVAIAALNRMLDFGRPKSVRVV
ncbi:hypothetical protein [Azospirillum argentinense]|uniref:hypothetical protein n=1 Tax=Azospirillum argentinense TaxID=2970906 RepID=UPI001585E6A3|nr:hypothetical protein [Azospirillum argentinense]